MLDIRPDLLRQILSHDELSPDEVHAIAQTAYIAAELDFHEDLGETQILDQLGGLLWSAANLPAQDIAPVSPLPFDDEERRALIHELASRLSTRGARELAYALAYLTIANDLELAPVEGRFLDELQHALVISDERAADLAASSAESATPGIEAAGGSHEREPINAAR